MKNKIMGLLSLIFAFNFATGTSAMAYEQGNASKKKLGHDVNEFEYQQVHKGDNRHSHQSTHQQFHNQQHINYSNYNNSHYNKNQQHAKLKAHHKPVVSFIEIKSSYIPVLSIIVSKNKVFKHKHQSVKQQKSRYKRQQISQYKRKHDTHYGSVNYLAFDQRR